MKTWDEMTEPEREHDRYLRQQVRSRAEADARNGATARISGALHSTRSNYGTHFDKAFGRAGDADQRGGLGLTLGDQVGKTPAELRTLEAEIIQAVDDTGLQALIPTLLPKWTAAYVADHRRTLTGTADPGAGVDADAALRAALRQEYGATEAAALLVRTRAFINAHPALAKLLKVGTLALDRDVMLGIAARVRQAGYVGGAC